MAKGYSARGGFGGSQGQMMRQQQMQQKIMQMQQQMAKAQEDVENTDFTASAGGGAAGRDFAAAPGAAPTVSCTRMGVPSSLPVTSRSTESTASLLRESLTKSFWHSTVSTSPSTTPAAMFRKTRSFMLRRPL